jgi:hypothetical protein
VSDTRNLLLNGEKDKIKKDIATVMHLDELCCATWAPPPLSYHVPHQITSQVNTLKGPPGKFVFFKKMENFTKIE